MIEIERSGSGTLQRVVLRPNQSMSWRALAYFYMSLVLLSFTLAGGLALLGFWPVVPFAGLEMLILGIVLYLVARRGGRCEVISLKSDTVLIEKGRYRPEQSWIFLRIWAKVILEHCPKQWYPSRLLIRSHGRGVEIGQFLNEDERQRLAKELTRGL
jgi:uncharacterized membrane protein